MVAFVRGEKESSKKEVERGDRPYKHAVEESHAGAKIGECEPGGEGAVGKEIMLEKDIEKQIVDYLTLDGWICRKMEFNFSEKKSRSFGQKGMPDRLCIRYVPPSADGLGELEFKGSVVRQAPAEVMWLELKRMVRKKATKPSEDQRDWHFTERCMGALTLTAGVDFPATFEGFQEYYEKSGLRRRVAARGKA